uniref:PHD finger protein ALFIN-LIKE 4-like n=1 Tax=Diabrotica virgifera virgifera TaxID=50390 RepID=A0A6P7G065_DIAVI
MTDKTDSAFTVVSPEIIMPIPKVQEIKKRTTRKRGKTAVLTDSPYKRELEATMKEKEEKTIAKENRARQRLFENEAKVMSQKKNGKTTESDSDECSDCECLYCGDFYSKSLEGWVACSLCRKWAHNSCAGVDSEDDEAILVCEHCQQD